MSAAMTGSMKNYPTQITTLGNALLAAGVPLAALPTLIASIYTQNTTEPCTSVGQHVLDQTLAWEVDGAPVRIPCHSDGRLFSHCGGGLEIMRWRQVCRSAPLPGSSAASTGDKGAPWLSRFSVVLSVCPSGKDGREVSLRLGVVG